MAVDREAIAVALFDRLKAATRLTNAERRFRSWDDVPRESQPWLGVVQRSQSPEQRRGLPPKWRLEFTAYLYCRTEDRAATPSTQLNLLLQAIEAGLELQPGEDAGFDPQNVFGTTLGGLCSHAWISGTIETDEGALDNQAVAIIPIEVLTA